MSVLCKSFLVAQQLHSYKFWFDSTSIFFIYCSNFLLTKQVPVAEWLAQQTEVVKVASSNPLRIFHLTPRCLLITLLVLSLCCTVYDAL